jgi:hypothetical protein
LNVLPQNDRSNFRDTNLMEWANRRKACGTAPFSPAEQSIFGSMGDGRHCFIASAKGRAFCACG